nr:hypothetical protein - Arabidopsis thaliana [Arabidopsis thaliana]
MASSAFAFPSYIITKGGLSTDSYLPSPCLKPNNNSHSNRRAKVCASLAEKGEYYSNRPPTPLLDTINYPIHMKNLSVKELKQLSDELRSDVIFNVSKTGGHLGSSLGVVELTVALHYIFNTPQDKILWDVGHQSYPHKILTGRRGKMPTMRQTNGLSGFTKRGESEHDCFGTGHSSTTISAGLGNTINHSFGMAVGRDLKGKNNNVVAVIGDGAMTAGQAYEAMNNAGYLDSDMIVILNDNKQVSLPTATLDGPSPPVGALSSALSRLQSNPALRELREVAKASLLHFFSRMGMTKQIGGPMHQLAAKVDEYARGMISGTGSSLFEELGLYYIGPVDGHNIDDLVAILKEVKSTRTTGPVLIHVVTEKGRGYPYAERADDKYHGKTSVVKFDPATGRQFKTTNKTQSYTTYFAEALVAEAEVDKDVVAIHAAMGGGTGLNLFQRRFPTRCFDVGIAEQHAVVHDVDLQKLPVRFAMDRAGLVGADGPTHCGAFDVTFMACLPNMIVMAPSDEADLFNMVATAVAIDDRPSCFRYPRGNGIGVALPPGNKGVPIEKISLGVFQIGKGRILKEGERVALLGYGSAVQSCLGAAVMLEERGLNVTVADARFCKPLDRALIRSLAKSHEVLITVEEGSIGGFGSHVVQFLALDGLLDGKLKWRPMVLPDRYIDHGAPADQLAEAGLMPSHIAATALNLIGAPREALF